MTQRLKEIPCLTFPRTATCNGSFGSTGLRLKLGLAEMLKGGVIMDVMNVEQARIAEEAGAISVMALERVPAMIRAEGGVARMASPKLIKQIINAVSIPVMAKARIGHFAEAQVLQHLGVDFIDESEVLTPADEMFHIDKHAFTTPFVCGARNLGEALRRIAEGAAMIRTKGEPGTGDVVHAVQHMRQIVREIKALTVLGDEELYNAAKVHGAPYELVRMVAKVGQAAGAELFRGRHCDSGRRGADDAAGRGDGLRWVGHLYEGAGDAAGCGEQSAGAGGGGVSGARDRDCDDALQRSEDCGGGQRDGDWQHEGPGCGGH